MKLIRSTFSTVLLLLALSSYAVVSPRLIHVYVALCDNDSQGIVPVPRKIGNGNDPDNNLYWGCGYGLRTFFSKAEEWKRISSVKNAAPHILERLVFKHKASGTVLVADAYRGSRIKDCTVDFLNAASGNSADTSDLVCYVGHDGLMDFALQAHPKKKGTKTKDVMILACVSKSYFKEAVKEAGANPLLWTTGLMCPEAYTLKAAIDGWILRESGAQLKERAAQAYNQYLKCGIKGARGLFATGF